MTATLHHAPPTAPVDAASWRLAVEGARDISPMIVGVLPLALAIGAAIGTSSVPAFAGWAGGLLIFGGAAQLSTIEMLDAGAAPTVIIMSALLINARVLMYSAAFAPWFRCETLGRRLLLAVPIIDPLYFTAVPRFEQGDLGRRGRQAYYAGAAVALAGAWLAVQAVAITAGASLPDALGLEIAAPLAFAGLLAKSIPNTPAVATAVTASIIAVIAVGLPFQAGLLLATTVAIFVGHMVQERGRRNENEVTS